VSRKPDSQNTARSEKAADEPMTDRQAAVLQTLARDALEPEAFAPDLTQIQAEQRIAALRAKLRLQDGPPHTL